MTMASISVVMRASSMAAQLAYKTDVRQVVTKVVSRVGTWAEKKGPLQVVTRADLRAEWKVGMRVCGTADWMVAWMVSIPAVLRVALRAV